MKNYTNEKFLSETRYHHFEYTIYDGDDNIKFAELETIKQIAKNDFYAFIKHDGTLNEDGTKKKDHWHVLISFENAKRLEAYSKILQKMGFGDDRLPTSDRPGNVYVKDDLNESIKYLVHMSKKARLERKQVYDISQIQTNNRDKVMDAILSVASQDRLAISKNLMIAQTYMAIDDMEYISRSEWFRLCNEMGIDSNIAKANDVLKYIDDHNKKFEKGYLDDLKLQAKAYKDIRGKVVSVFNQAISVVLDENKQYDAKMALDIRNKATTFINDQLTGIIADIELLEIGGIK